MVERAALLAGLGMGVFRARPDGSDLQLDDVLAGRVDASCIRSLEGRLPADGSSLELEVQRADGVTMRVTARRTTADGEAWIEGLVQPVDGTLGAGPTARFQHLYEHSPVAMHSIDERGRIVSVNRAWLELTEYERAEVIGRHATFLMTEEGAERASREYLPDFWRDGHSRAVPNEYVRADGRVIDVELDCDATTTPGGERVSLTVVRDVTARNRAQQALASRERELLELIQRSPDGILLHREGVIVYANSSAATLLGVDEASELSGRPVPGDLSLAVADGALIEVRLELGGERPDRMVEAASLEVTFEGEPTTLVMARDVTERRTLQAQLAQADRLATIGTLAAGVAHEINNPLTYVMHYIERLQRDLTRLVPRVEAGQDVASVVGRLRTLQEGAATALEGCGRVRDIVRDLKTFSRTEERDRVPIDVNRALGSAVQMASHHVRGKGELSVELGALPAVRAHDGRLCQVFLNLLLNAAQAIEDRGEGHVRVQSRHDDGVVIVSVADDGCGVAGEHLARLFEPFFSTKPNGVGTGLGLWICREIVHDLGGHIEVDSQVGEGSTFRVVLPAAQGASVEPSLPPPPAREIVLATPPRRRVLVVDDEPALRMLLAEALSDRAQVLTAQSGVEAAELLDHDSRFDAILCDLMMPGMNGQQLFDHVARHHPSLVSRMIFMTGAASTVAIRDFLGRIANDRLDKPFRVRDVERALDRLMGPPVRVHA
ncbi:MAG TPA: hypothetical protein DEF51_31160 [Myxococcales bacterium]|nr:hypothetical protein [Myxococcales bacterium]